MFRNQKLMIEEIKNNIFRMDKMILLIVYALVTISTVFVYSATRQSGMVIKNILWIAVGSILVLLLSYMDYRNLKRYVWHIDCAFCRKKDSGSTALDFLGTISIAAFRICKSGNYYNNRLLDCNKV